jgi:hypothetical protein
MKRLIAIFAASAGFLAAPLTVSAEPCSLTSLGWLAANWLNGEAPDRARETWTAAPGGVLMGSAFEFPQGKAGFAEFMTIREGDGGVVMLLRHFDGALARAWEERDAPMVFTAASCEASSVRFDGQGAHLGEHLTYRRTGVELNIKGDFLHGGNPVHVEWRMIKAAN